MATPSPSGNGGPVGAMSFLVLSLALAGVAQYAISRADIPAIGAMESAAGPWRDVYPHPEVVLFAAALSVVAAAGFSLSLRRTTLDSGTWEMPPPPRRPALAWWQRLNLVTADAGAAGIWASLVARLAAGSYKGYYPLLFLAVLVLSLLAFLSLDAWRKVLRMPRVAWQEVAFLLLDEGSLRQGPGGHLGGSHGHLPLSLCLCPHRLQQHLRPFPHAWRCVCLCTACARRAGRCWLGVAWRRG